MPNFGDDTQGTGTTNGSGDRAYVTRFTMPENGTASSAHAYFDSGSTAGTNAKVILFSNSGGAPSARLAVSGAAAIPAGGGLVNFGSISYSLVSGTDYFLGVVYDSFTGNLQTDTGLSGIDSELANGTFSYDTPPATWPGTDVSYTDARANVYITYTTGGGGGGTPALRLSLLGVGL